MAAKTFEQWVESKYVYVHPNMVIELKPCWEAATEFAKDKIVELYASWCIANPGFDTTAVNNFVDWAQKRLTEE